MIVVTLEKCPPALRGDLTKWLFEVNTGVYVGHVSSRVRDRLWQRICDQIKDGRATMVFSMNTEQRFDFRVHNSQWQIVDFDGLKLMLHPSAPPAVSDAPRSGYSNAAKQLMARRAAKKSASVSRFPDDYVLLDVETTGLRERVDRLIELSAVRVLQGEVQDTLHAPLQPGMPLPEMIVKLTGITDDLLTREGRSIAEVLPAFLDFIGSLPLISHNIRFDMRFLYAACEEQELALPKNRCIDTLELARRAVRGVSDYKLTTLAKSFGLDTADAHRSAGDCLLTKAVYEKVIEILDARR